MRITLTLTDKEIDALRNDAQKWMRGTKEHARFLLASALGLIEKESLVEKNKEQGDKNT